MPVIGNQIIKTGYETHITLAGGRIRCLRCTAKSVRSGLQCAKPAMKSSRTQKCSHHGGRPHSPEVLRRISEANTLHGESTKVAKEQYRQDAVDILHLEDAMRVLKMGEGPSMRGRKPAGYRGVYSEADVVWVISEMLLHRM